MENDSKTPAASRRSFLKTSGLTAGSLALPNIIIGQETSPNEKINIASVGVQGKGLSDRGKSAEGNNIVALCDADLSKITSKEANWKGEVNQDSTAPAGLFPEAAHYQDFRKMFDEMDDKIDAVLVSTPDHAHFPIAMEAVKRGKHVYVQKPMCNTISEVRALHAAAKEAGVVTQMGNQGRTRQGQRMVKEWIEQGAIGKLKEIRLWTNRPIWPQGTDVAIKEATTPETLDWDVWQAQTGPNPYRDSIHPFSWRGWWEYGSGALGDMGCHIMDAPFYILGGAFPKKIEAKATKFTDLIAPNASTLTYTFDSPIHGEIPLTWDDGSMKPAFPEGWDFETYNDIAPSGHIFIGTEGIIYNGDAYCTSPRLVPETKMVDWMQSGQWQKTEKRSKHEDNPQQEWLATIRGEDDTECFSAFDYSAPLTEMVLLGNLAIRSRQTVHWDAGQMTSGNPAIDKFIGRAGYRDGWDYGAKTFG